MGNPKKPRRRYRTRMFDNRLSLPATSEQVRQLQAEADAEKRSVASLVREAIDQFLPRLRDRRRKRQRPPGGFPRKAVRRLLGEPQKRTSREEWRYGPEGSLRINLKAGTWYNSQTKEGGSILDLIQRELKTDQAGALDWLTREGLFWEKDP